jgi:hypothetical protein
MKPDIGRDPSLPIWTYGYALIPPIARDRMGPMEILLDDGHTKARRASRTWEGRLIDGEGVSHIMVVCDTPDRNLEINGFLEAELARLEALYLVTESILVQRGSGQAPAGASDP